MRSLIERFSEIDVVNLTSTEINKYLQAISNDIINAYNDLEEKAEKLEKINTVLTYENESIYKQLDSLYTAVDSVANSLHGMTRQYKSYHSSEKLNVLDGEINTEYGYLAPLTETHKKINYAYYPLEFLISKFNIDLKIYKHLMDEVGNIKDAELVESISIKDDRSLINLCNAIDTDFYLHSNTVDSSTAYLSYELYIGLPQDIMPNLMINSITLNPLISGNMELNEVSFLHENTYNAIPNIRNSMLTKSRYIIDPIYSNNLKFVFHQFNYVEKDGKREFLFGLRDIGLDSISVLSNTIEWISTYNLFNKGYSFHSIDTPKIVSNGQYTDLTYELYLDKELTQKIECNTELTVNTDTIYIKYKLTSLATQIPLVYGDHISYEIRI